MFTRKIWVLLLALVVAALSLLGAGRVAAEPQLPRIAIYSDNFGTVGDHNNCRGALNVGVIAPKGKRGTIRVTVTSFGFTGDGTGWTRNPKCRFLLRLTQWSAKYPVGKEEFYPVAFGPRRGERFVRELHPGSGIGSFNVATYAINQPVQVPQSYGGSGFLATVP
ncbi:enoyl-CoA hydratase [Streptomyces sp. SID6673]|nr:enoyl-CoA hydratase [Streptomyces sp. SID11726]NEB26462.1 enoyl-CoA hydratase [Streptomyces sp. SID6673]